MSKAQNGQVYVVEPRKKVWARDNRFTGLSMLTENREIYRPVGASSPARLVAFMNRQLTSARNLSDRAPPFYAKNPKFSITGVRYPPLRQLKKLQLPPPPWNLAVCELLEVDTKVNVPIGRIDPAESTLPLFCFIS